MKSKMIQDIYERLRFLTKRKIIIYYKYYKEDFAIKLIYNIKATHEMYVWFLKYSILHNINYSSYKNNTICKPSTYKLSCVLFVSYLDSF